MTDHTEDLKGIFRTTQAAPLVLGVAVHSGRVAATRLRLLQYAPALAGEGIEFRLWSFLSEAEEDNWFGRSWLRRCACVLRGFTRLATLARLVRRARVVVVQREALPFGPPLIERLIKRYRNMIWDVDDAVWEHHTSVDWLPRWFRATGHKYRRLCATADEVWAGSDVLVAWCRVHNAHVELVPTVVDVPFERPNQRAARSVGWIGSPTTASFVEAILPAIAVLPNPPRVIVLGADPAVPDGLDVRAQRWSPEAEEAALQQLKVGLYPIDMSHPLAEGKCGLKAVLYMSRGIPPVVTPTTTNATIVRDCQDGLHVWTAAEWTAATRRLLDDPDLWERLSASAWLRARENYSVSAWQAFVVRRIRALL